MQHPPPSSAAPAAFAVPGSSISADPTVHDTNKNTNTNKSSSKFKKLRITKDIEVFDIPPYKPRPNEKKLVHDDKRYKPNVDLSNIVFKPGPALDVFDAKNPPPKFAFPVHFEEDPSLRLRLTECATLAIGDYNSQTKSDYRFVDIEMATWQLVNGTFYNITFQAMNAATKKCETFEATVFFNRRVREVQQIRMKGSDDWYVGTLSELVK